MKKMFVIVLAVIIGLALAAAGFAADNDSKTDKGKTDKGKTFTGTVTSVDTSAKNLVVKGKGGDKTFDVTDAKWKGYSSLDDIKAGDKVTVMYTEKDDGSMVAKNVAKMKAKTKKTTTKTQSTTETKTDSDAESK